MEKHGVRVLTGCTIAAIERTGSRFSARLSSGNHVAADCVMFATGRNPNVTGIGLEKAGVAIAANGGVAVDEYSRTAKPHIYAIGDVTNRVNLTPVAIREGAAFADTVFGGKPTAVDHTNVPTAVFSDPEIGAVGLTEAEARARLARTDIYRAMFRPLKATLSGRDTTVLLKLVVDGSNDRMVGCHIVGDGPARRHRREDGSHQGRFRRHPGAASDHRRGAGHHAAPKCELCPRSSRIAKSPGCRRLGPPCIYPGSFRPGRDGGASRDP